MEPGSATGLSDTELLLAFVADMLLDEVEFRRQGFKAMLTPLLLALVPPLLLIVVVAKMRVALLRMIRESPDSLYSECNCGAMEGIASKQ